MVTRHITLFSYQDYRAFLRDWFAHAKATRPHFSHRAFAQQAGLQSSNFLMLVMQRKRNLTEASLLQVMVGLKLNKQEREFFRNLVFMNQARTHAEQDVYYQRLLTSRKFRQLKPIERQQYAYYAAWYHPVVRELVVAKGSDGSPEWIATRITPAVTVQQVEKSIRLLEQLGFIKRVRGKWQQSETILSTGPMLSSVVVHNYHKAVLQLSQSVMDTMSTRQRDASALTLGVTRAQVALIRRKVQEFRQELLKLVADTTAPDEVLQLNMQLFPVTKMSSDDGEGGGVS